MTQICEHFDGGVCGLFPEVGEVTTEYCRKCARGKLCSFCSVAITEVYKRKGNLFCSKACADQVDLDSQETNN